MYGHTPMFFDVYNIVLTLLEELWKFDMLIKSSLMSLYSWFDEKP